MPKNLKRLVRERQLKTGESHQTAIRHVRGQRPPSEFEATVLRIIELAKARNRELDAQDSQGSLSTDDPNLGSHLQQYLRSPGRVALQAALLALSSVDLRKVKVLMYSGRERESVHTLEPTLYRDPTDRVSVSMIISKRPLDEYLEEGLALAKRDGVDLEGKF